MNSAETQRYLDSLSLHGIRPGLERMRTLMQAMGNPERSFRAVHVTGTNGKGSVCAMLESVFRQAGFKTALYTSPHLLDIRERIRLNGNLIPHSEFCKILTRVKTSSESVGLGKEITYFEATTAAAFAYFARKRVEIAVVEVGLGGRWDATNVLPLPELCILTNIGLEHTQYLGNTVEKIAAEKAGILKSGAPCLTGAQGKPRGVIRARAAELNAAFYENLPAPGLQNFLKTVSLKGSFQKENVNLVLNAVKILRSRGWKIKDPALRLGLKKTSWPGRFDQRTLTIKNKKISVIVDGAHNPAAIQALLSSLEKMGQAKAPCTLVFNALQDKNAKRMAEMLANRLKVRKAWIPGLNTPRSIAPETMTKNFKGKIEATPFSSLQGLQTVLMKENVSEKNRWMLVTGSLYLTGEFLGRFKKQLSKS